jgi:integrase
MDGEQPNSLTAQQRFYHEQTGPQPAKTWSARYGERHRLTRLTEFPVGITPPKRVRIYVRRHHHVLQWWDKSAKRNLCERVDGDLVTAIARARQIEERLEHFRSSGLGVRKTGHQTLMEQFLADLHRRADAGEIDPRTVQRYGAALKHYRNFVEQPATQRQFPHISSANRDFALALMAYLNTVQVPSNGHANSQSRPMQRQDYVLDVVRAMYRWASDPDRGKLIPEGFRNPFFRRDRSGRASAVQIGEPDITTEMAVDFLNACDAYQLRLFAPFTVYGLRAAEPCFLLHEHVDQDWLRVPCLPDLVYQTKSRREKRLPLIPCLAALLKPISKCAAIGLVYLRRGVTAGVEKPPLAGSAVEDLVQEFRRRCVVQKACTAVSRRRVRDEVLHAAGGIGYDHILAEFNKVARGLRWPRAATIKDFRHLFATCLENAGVPEHYRKFLMGQSPGRAAIVTYTHLNEIRQRFNEAVQKTLGPLVAAIERRSQDLGLDT